MKTINAELLIERIEKIQNDMILSINDSAKAKDIDEVLKYSNELTGVCHIKALIEEMANDR